MSYIYTEKKKKDVLLCVFSSAVEKSVAGRSPGRSRSPHGREVSKATASITKKSNEVADIVEKLEEANSGKYSPEQLHTWAHLIHMKKHSSYTEPPDKPFRKES